MEVFIHNLPQQTSEKQLDKFFRNTLSALNVTVFHCQKLGKPGLATLTFLDPSHALLFLKVYGKYDSHIHGSSPPSELRHLGKVIQCVLSRNKPNTYLLRILEEEKKKQHNASRKAATAPKPKLERKIEVSELSCGSWDFVGSDLVFVPYFTNDRGGDVRFGKKSLAILIGKPTTHRVEVPYSSINSVTRGATGGLSLTFTLFEAPRTYAVKDTNAADAASLMLRLSFAYRQRPPSSKIKWTRVTCINKSYESVFSNCFVYRLTIPQSAFATADALKKAREIPSITLWPTTIRQPVRPFASELTRLSSALASSYGGIPWVLKFQMQRLVQFGYLSPSRVVELLSEVFQMTKRSDLKTCLAAVQKLFGQLPYQGPDTETDVFKLETLVQVLKQNETAVKNEDPRLSRAKQHKNNNLALIHRVIVTPAGTYPYGPDEEPMNRVLRKYAQYLDFFLKVTFADEDGDQLRFYPGVSHDEIYHDRFKKVLSGVINIAGRGFEFLGFSHSSLRAQTCWFMAPFTHNGTFIHAGLVIKGLGDFSKIRTPAKCAARIGQAFSDTLTAVNIPSDCVENMDDVERSGRVFSDGCGVISQSIQQRIFKQYSVSQKLKPTVFQIRYAGAKGMISVDPRLNGDVLGLRPSMVKFPSDAHDIEICNSGINPLSMYLNRQLIKILEDLGVEDGVFLHLQEIAVERLRTVTRSPVNAAHFLRQSHVGDMAHIPELIEKLSDLGLSFLSDDFLRDMLELAILVQLRALKHRARILVDDGVTLYGIMDETGYLEEGQIFCVTATDTKKRKVLQGRVAVTRCPALHPGDIQIAYAVDVPVNSPLRFLHNCVVFSQKGERDLPSQLSGGDLDGDLFNIIQYPGLLPKFVAEPADYPRVTPLEIETTVERHHMADFFIQFMENDQLGRIATMHQVLADQLSNGTCHPSCLLLASKHSTAVDFSKTGIPVDLTDLPKYSKFRPDFMAPGPRVILDQGQAKFDGDDETVDLENDEEYPDDSPTEPGLLQYYKSDRILGKLYRAIDEESFLASIQGGPRTGSASRKEQSVLDKLWLHVKRESRGVDWIQHSSWAREIKETYEDSLIEIMSQYSMNPSQYLTEVEVFVGDILGRYGPQSKRQRDASLGMRDRFERDARFIVDCIIKEDQSAEGAKSKEALPRSIACLSVAVTESRPRRQVGTLRSFGYVAAAVCLREMAHVEGYQVFKLPKVGISGRVPQLRA